MNAHNKVAVVTGAGSGIGKSVALALLEHGYCVALAGRRKGPLEQTVKDAGSGGAQAVAVPADVSKPESVAALFARVKEVFGRLDLLFNNAGVFPPGLLLEDLSFEQWKTAVDINLTGAFLCTQEAFRIMKSQVPRGGRIINNGSISAHAPRPNSAPYTATKHAITGLTKCTSLDGRKYDIACGQIDIGNARTELAGPMAKGITQADGHVAVEPLLDLTHVTSAVLYMASLPIDANVQFMSIVPQFHETFEKRWNVPWREAYGMTETGADLMVPVQDASSVGSGAMGKPFPTKEAQVVDAAGADPEVKVVIVRGEGRAFCSGDDLSEDHRLSSAEEGLRMIQALQDTTRAIMGMPKPVIAAVHGYALGAGCEWAMNCDIRIAAAGTKFGFPEASVGAIRSPALEPSSCRCWWAWAGPRSWCSLPTRSTQRRPRVGG